MPDPKNNPAKYLYRDPKTGVLTGLWACGSASGKYWGTWPPRLIWRIKIFGIKMV